MAQGLAESSARLIARHSRSVLAGTAVAMVALLVTACGSWVSYGVTVTVTDGESPPQVGTLKFGISPVSA